jgi:hypothetical protein
MFKWVEGWRRWGHHITAREVAEQTASALLMSSFISMALVAIFDSNRRWVGLKGVAGLGLVSLCVRAGCATWPYLASRWRR